LSLSVTSQSSLIAEILFEDTCLERLFLGKSDLYFSFLVFFGEFGFENEAIL